jgi:hypothetical protein
MILYIKHFSNMVVCDSRTSDHVASVRVEKNVEISMVQGEPSQSLSQQIVGQVHTPLTVRVRTIYTVKGFPHAHTYEYQREYY